MRSWSPVEIATTALGGGAVSATNYSIVAASWGDRRLEEGSARAVDGQRLLCSNQSSSLSLAGGIFTSLKVTTRLMHSIAWLLNQKALRAGEITPNDAYSDARNLGYSPASDSFQVGRFPQQAQLLIAASEDLYFRLQRFSSKMRTGTSPVSEPLMMMDRLRASF